MVQAGDADLEEGPGRAGETDRAMAAELGLDLAGALGAEVAEVETGPEQVPGLDQVSGTVPEQTEMAKDPVLAPEVAQAQALGPVLDWGPVLAPLSAECRAGDAETDWGQQVPDGETESGMDLDLAPEPVGHGGTALAQQGEHPDCQGWGEPTDRALVLRPGLVLVPVPGLESGRGEV